STGITTTLSWGNSTDLPVPGDYDGDGKADPAVFRPSTGVWYGLESSTSYATQWSMTWGARIDVPGPNVILLNSQTVERRPPVADATRPPDFDGDNKADLTVYRPTSGTWFTLKSQSNYTVASSVVWGTSTDVPVPGDYDGDGKADPA